MPRSSLSALALAVAMVMTVMLIASHQVPQSALAQAVSSPEPLPLVQGAPSPCKPKKGRKSSSLMHRLTH